LLASIVIVLVSHTPSSATNNCPFEDAKPLPDAPHSGLIPNSKSSKNNLGSGVGVGVGGIRVNVGVGAGVFVGAGVDVKVDGVSKTEAVADKVAVAHDCEEGEGIEVNGNSGIEDVGFVKIINPIISTIPPPTIAHCQPWRRISENTVG